MKRTLLPTLVLLPFLALAPPSLPAQEKVGPGQEGDLLLPDCQYPGKIYVPTDHAPGKRLPLILFMHGAGARPTTWPWRSATGGKGYVIVGLAYEPMPGGGQGRNGIQMSPAKCREMIAHTNRVRAHVQKVYGTDPKRVICSGLSMGGWAVDGYAITEECKGLYRAYCIMAAGPRQCGLFKPEVARDLPVLILNGANDPNLRVANSGKPILEKAGAVVTQEIIPGQGHVPSTPSMAPLLKKWLDGIAKADARAAGLAAVRWQTVELAGAPEKARGQGTAVQLWLERHPWVQRVPGDKPILLWFHSRKEKKGKPTRQARDSLAVERKLFLFPDACEVPAASRACACFRIDVTEVDRKANWFVNQGQAPLVVLLARDRKVAGVFKKGQLREPTLTEAILAQLGDKGRLAVQARIDTTRPILAELKKVAKKLEGARKALAKVRGRGGRKAARFEKEVAALQQEYDKIRERLLGK